MLFDLRKGQVTASVEEIALYNMLRSEAIFELLAEKSVLTGGDVKARTEKLKAETRLLWRRLQ